MENVLKSSFLLDGDLQKENILSISQSHVSVTHTRSENEFPQNQAPFPKAKFPRWIYV